MNNEEKNKEVFKLLTYIYAEWGKEIKPELVAVWADQLRGIPRRMAWKAARLLIRTKTYGEPRFQDFAACLREVWPTEQVGSLAHGYTQQPVKIGKLAAALASNVKLIDQGAA